MSQKQIDILQRALNREKEARKQAEKILEEKSAELFELTERLKESNQKLGHLVSRQTSELQGVFENIVDAYIVIDLSGNFIKMNDAAIEMLGYDIKNEEINLLSLIHPEESKRATKNFNSLLSNGTLTNFVVRIITKDKVHKLVHINSSIIYDDNIPIAAQGIIRDITKQKEAELQLKESEKRLATLILNLDSGMLLEDENRKIVLTNKKFCEFFQIPAPPESLKGMDCTNAADQSRSLFENPDQFVKRITEIVKNKKTVLGDQLKMKNGQYLERDFIPIFSNDEYKGHLWSYRDITLRKRYDQSIQAEKEKYSNIIANMNLGLVQVNNDDEIQLINQSFSQMSGYREEELIGKKGAEIFPIKEQSEIITREGKKRLKGKSNSYEITVKTKSGDIRHWLISGAPNYNLNGEVIGSIGIHLDITELKNLQLQKEKLLSKLEKSNDELKEYAHIVSHDLKSPLRSIYALVNWLKEDNEGKLDEASLQNISLIESTLEKMEQLITDVLEYSSIDSNTSENKDVDLNETIQELIALLFVPDHIEIKVLNTLPVINGNKTKLLQLFQNLISNAIKFNDKEEGVIEVNVEQVNGFYQFSVKDNGIGIDKKYHGSIFNIFSTLNKSKDSTGIGLSIVKKIVELHGGTIWLESTPKAGTTFYFTLKK